jgi:hypothetical protein
MLCVHWQAAGEAVMMEYLTMFSEKQKLKRALLQQQITPRTYKVSALCAHRCATLRMIDQSMFVFVQNGVLRKHDSGY